ncbi:hypothetical protein PTI97_11080 [Exiguobacterium marinum]|uniref:BIG2 domain-containing protein n=1 Tax=Exiguobacterium marinum TaxID=273528 RepID=A0ABY7X0B1_9BACL|nr:hypothetical protein [Exiguobacterium marinum]WDH75361.1 hypothetical protein PTI97_11080 [Exiguobacterium marinum]
MKRWLRMTGLLILFSLFSYSTAEAALVVEPTSSIEVGNPTNYVVGNEHLYIGGEDGYRTYQLSDGSLVHDVKGQATDLLDVSDDGEWVLTKQPAGLVTYDAEGMERHIIEEAKWEHMTISFKDDQVQARFLPGSSIAVILTESSDLVWYDVATNEVKKQAFIGRDERYDPQNQTLRVSKQLIAVGEKSKMSIYTHEGKWVSSFGIGDLIESFDVTDDNLLVMVSADGGLNEHNPITKTGFLREIGIHGNIVVSPNGTFFSNETSLYDFKTGKRIYSSIQPGRVVFTPDSTRFISLGKRIEIYHTSSLDKRIRSIAVNSELKRIETDTKIRPSLIVTRADGTKETITEGVAWTSTAPERLAIEKGMFVGKQSGPVVVNATYEDHTTLFHLKVVEPPPLTDLEWLKAHKKALDQHGSFDGADHKIGTLYAKVKAPAGKLLIDKKIATRGKYHHDFMYAATNRSKKVNEIVLSFWNYKRPNITESVVQRAFGKPTQTWTKKSKSFETIRGSKSWEKRSVGKIAAYRTKQKHTVWMYYDTSGKLRMFRLFESAPK